MCACLMQRWFIVVCLPGSGGAVLTVVAVLRTSCCGSDAIVLHDSDHVLAMLSLTLAPPKMIKFKIQSIQNVKNNFDFQKPQIGFSKAKKNKWPYLLNYTMDFDKLFRKMPPHVHMNSYWQYHIPVFCHLRNKALTYHDHNDRKKITSLSHEI